MPVDQRRPARLRRGQLGKPGAARAVAAHSFRTKVLYALAFCVNVAIIAALLWVLASRGPPPEHYGEKVLDPASGSDTGRSGGTDERGRHGAHEPRHRRSRRPTTEPFSDSEDKEPPRPLGDIPESGVHTDRNNKVHNDDSSIQSTIFKSGTKSETTIVAEIQAAGTTEATTSETAPKNTTQSTKMISNSEATATTTRSTPTASTPKTTFLVTNSTTSTTSSPKTTTEEALNFEVDISPSYSVVCYFNHTSYRRQEPMSFHTGHIPVPYCSHIIYASVGVNDEYELVAKDPTFDIEHGGFAKFAALKKRYRQVSVIVAIGEDIEDSNAFQRMSMQKQDVAAFVRKVALWLQQYGYDGVVIQWKMPVNHGKDSGAKASRYRQKLLGVAAALRDSLGSKCELFVAVPNDEEVRRTYFNFAELSRHIDRFLVIANWVLQKEDSRADGNSTVKVAMLADPLNDVLHTRHALVGAGDVQLFRKFCFVLSVGAKTYTLLNSGRHDANATASGPGRPGPYTRQPGLLAYYEVCNQTWPTKVQGTFASYVVRDDQWVGYLDASNMQRLLRMALYKHRAACLGIWDVSLDDFRGVCGDAFPFIKVISGWHDKEWRSPHRVFRSRPNKE